MMIAWRRTTGPITVTYPGNVIRWGVQSSNVGSQAKTDPYKSSFGQNTARTDPYRTTIGR